MQFLAVKTLIILSIIKFYAIILVYHFKIFKRKIRETKSINKITFEGKGYKNLKWLDWDIVE